MSLSAMRDPGAVRQAMAEFDRLGREAFRHKYRYGKRTRYAVAANVRRCDPKAILGVAHGFEFPAEGPLWWKSFNGGQQTNAKLQELGFRGRI